MCLSKIPQARIALNRECRKRCIYCTPRGEAGCAVGCLDMAPEEVAAIADVLADHGVNSIKLTGGDPLLRDDLPSVVRGVCRVPGIKDVEIVTKSGRLRTLVSELVVAGVTGVTVSLDSLKQDVVRYITGVDCLQGCLNGIRAARRVGLAVTINMVIMRNINENEIFAMIQFAADHQATLKLLDLIRLPDNDAFWRQHFLPLNTVALKLAKHAESVMIETHPGGIGHPMRLFVLPNGARVLIKDATAGAWYGDICQECSLYPCHDAITALWVTPDGKLKRCLTRDDHYVGLLAMLKGNTPRPVIDNAVDAVIATYARAEFRQCPWTHLVDTTLVADTENLMAVAI